MELKNGIRQGRLGKKKEKFKPKNHWPAKQNRSQAKRSNNYLRKYIISERHHQVNGKR